MSEATCYQKNRNVILNGAKDYYKNDQEGLRDNARDKYGRNRCDDMSKKKKRIKRISKESS